MSAGRAAAPRWKRGIIRILAVLVLAPVILLVLANLILATPWPRAWLAGKISARTGVEATIGRATWTPWGGGFVGDLALLQPAALQAAAGEPLVQVRGVRVFPRWDRLIRGELAIDGIEVDRPRVVIPLELLATLVSAGGAGLADEPGVAPELAVAADPAPPAPDPGRQPAAPPAAGSAEPAAKPADRSEPNPSTAWLKFEGGSLDGVTGGGAVLKISGLSGEIPLSGAPAVSEFRIGRLESLGRPLATDLVLPLSLKGRELRTRSSDLRIAGLRFELAAAVGLVRGVPFAVDCVLAEQALDATPYLTTLRPHARRVQARLRGQGALRFPASWQGGAEFGAEEIELTLAGRPVEFDLARGVFLLEAGGLRCPDLRLTGEQMSFLGNGHIGPGGEGDAVLRAVVPPDLAEVWTRGFTVQGQPPAFAPLETRDRYFIDLRWISYPGGHGVELGAGGPVVPLGEARLLFAPVVAN